MRSERGRLIRRCLRPAGLSLALASAAATAATGAPQIAPATATAPASRPRVVDFQPGIRIDWAHRQVAVAATVILRRGPIELFACSPQIREHESIVRIEARPLHLFQALGLIGLEPGHPPQYDARSDRYYPAAGDPVEILIRYRVQGQDRVDPIERWMRNARTGREIGPQPWVFAGSARLPDGGFDADVEGTVIAVVDFTGSLIALPEYHSERNEELWLEPFTERIPPERTPCTLLLRPGPFRLALGPAGRVRLGERTVTLAEAALAVRRARQKDVSRTVLVTVDDDCPPSTEAALLGVLESLGLPEGAIAIHRTAPTSEPASGASTRPHGPTAPRAQGR